MKTFLVLAGALLAAVSAQAEAPVPAEVFGDAMVLQRDTKVPVFGKAAPDTTVTVSFAGQKKETKAGPDGAWKVELDPMRASTENRVLTLAAGTERREIKDVLVGDIWICSGQSNMEFLVGKSTTMKEDLKDRDPLLRLRTVAKQPAGTPQTALKATPWLPATEAKSISWFSAVGYSFGKSLRSELKVPVGMISSAWGGTRIEAWIPAGAQPATPSPANNAAHQRPSALYNGMVHPLTGFPIKGAIWYQGESNCLQKDGLAYADRMKALVSGWRQAFGRDDMPFYFTQIAPFDYGRMKGSNENLFALWKAQTLASKDIPGTGMAHTQDLGNWADIHPTNKRPVGERLARLALSRTYGVKLKDDTGPEFRAINLSGDKATLAFDHAKSGLKASDGKPLVGFEVAGDDGVFVPAEARISGDTVVVSAAKVKTVARVRFGAPTGVATNLANREGLPASAFEAAK